MRVHVLVFAVLGLAADAHAQRQIPVGARVRILLGEEQRQASTRFLPGLTIRGELVARSADSLWVRPTPYTGVVSVPRAAIRRVYESRGVPSRIAAMFIEGIGGAVVGAIEFALLSVVLNDSRLGDSVGEAAANGAVTGAVFGGAFGLLLPVERWRLRPLIAQ